MCGKIPRPGCPHPHHVFLTYETANCFLRAPDHETGILDMQSDIYETYKNIFDLLLEPDLDFLRFPKIKLGGR